jgi:hypothetical protein
MQLSMYDLLTLGPYLGEFICQQRILVASHDPHDLFHALVADVVIMSAW